MYSNNSESLRDALCFLMDEEQSRRIAFVQFPQNFDNLTKNDVYSSSLRIISEVSINKKKTHTLELIFMTRQGSNSNIDQLWVIKVELPGLDANGGPLYIGTGCFHKRVVLCGRKYSKDEKIDWSLENHTKVEESTHVLEETCKILASCTYEENTEWGKEVFLSPSLSLTHIHALARAHKKKHASYNLICRWG